MAPVDILLSRGRYRVRCAASETDLHSAQELRARSFGTGANGRDADGFDASCTHLLIEDATIGRLVACCRIMDLASGDAIDRSYAAQFYDLKPLRAVGGPLLEVGRFCVAPGLCDPDILRVAWAALTRHVDARQVALLFGCSSFFGTEPDRYRDAFGLLARDHIGPAPLRPGWRASQVVPLGQGDGVPVDQRAALRQMPPLLKSYLAMGGWVSDHAVVDAEMDTLHVFTAVETARIPAARIRLLRALAE